MSLLDNTSEQFTLGGNTGSCTEYTLPHDDQDSEPFGWIRGQTKIGPVLHVRVTCCRDQYGIEIQVPSMSRKRSCSWIVISRGPNRYVDESWHDKEEHEENGKSEMLILLLMKLADR